jgi:hypothetical protein
MDTTTKPKRAPRTKKAAATVVTDTSVVPSVVSAFGGTAAPPPSIFVEELDSPTGTPPITPPIKTKRVAGASKKPVVVASVTPEGIQGSLTPLNEQRPLITHLPIHLSDIHNDLFAADILGVGGDVVAVAPSPYDPTDQYIGYNQQNTPAAPLKETVAPVVTRPSLPLNYSERLMVRFQDANRVQGLPESTDIACFWDCHPFRDVPCVIPVGIEESIWRVYGNFCCPECAAAYLFNEALDSHVKWERYALLNRLYSQGEGSIRVAPPRTVLRLFGGTMEVSDYRATLAEKRLRIDVVSPPMISIIQTMDTKPIDFYDAAMKNTFIPWEMDRMNRPGAQGLRLRRTKPINEKEATIQHSMGIVFSGPRAVVA